MQVRYLHAALVCCLLLASYPSIADTSTGMEKSNDCLQCHNTVVSLQGRGAETIARQIHAIRAGDKRHPPGLDKLNADDIAEIAAFLDGA